MTGWFELNKSSGDQYRFILKARNGGVILINGFYTIKGAVEGGVASVQANNPLDECYEKKTAVNGKLHLDLKVANHRIIGNSQLYVNEQSRETGTAPVKTDGASQTIKNKT